MLAYLNKALAKSEDNLRKHEAGIWASGQDFVDRAKTTVDKWTRWRDLVVNLIAEQVDRGTS